MFILSNPPLVLRIANLLTDSIIGWEFKTTAQYRHLLAHSPSFGLKRLRTTTVLYRLASKNFVMRLYV